MRREFQFNPQSWIAVPVIGVIGGFVEALSPRGWDNVPMQIVPTGLSAVLLQT